MRSRIVKVEGNSSDRNVAVLAEKELNNLIEQIEKTGGNILDVSIQHDPSYGSFGSVFLSVFYKESKTQDEPKAKKVKVKKPRKKREKGSKKK